MTKLKKVKVPALQIDNTEKNKEIKINFNKLGFLVPICIQLMDELSESTVYRQQFKSSGNSFLSELEKINKIHFSEYNDYGTVENEGKPFDSRDLHNVTSHFYDKAFKFFTERNPSEVSSIINMIEEAEKNSLDLSEVLIRYKPLQK